MNAGSPLLSAVPPADRELVTLAPGRCLSLLGAQPVGRLVFTQRAMPEIIPVNFRLDGDRIVLSVSGESSAARACHDTVVAFQADRIEHQSRTGWSVTVVGRSREITDPVERCRVARLPLTSWLGSSRDHFISISMDRVTGREIVKVAPELRRG